MKYSLATGHDGVVVSLAERLTFEDHETFQAMLAELTASSAHGNAIFDLARLDYIDSAGVGLLLIAQDEVAKSNRKLIIRNAAGQVRKVFDLAHLDTVLTFAV